MSLSSLTAISPIDGRYYEKTSALNAFFSEFGLIYHRIIIEIRWLESLAEHPKLTEVSRLSPKAKQMLDDILKNFCEADAILIKKIEARTNHDVKAVEYFLKQKFQGHPELNALSEFIHFACTSEDINNLAYALMLKSARSQIILPLINDVVSTITEQAIQYADIAMLSRTHGQPASPTTLGKELSNFVFRLKNQINSLTEQPIKGKMNGAVGNFNAHCIAYPEVDWLTHSENFVKSLGLTWNPYTTQIESHDYIAELSHNMIRLNTIFINFSRDIWSYISIGYFKQKIVSDEVGSSTMPHKVNPIDFENAEGNLGLSNALFSYFAQQLAISRWQRDLTDSTLMRNLGSAFAYSIIAYQSLKKGCKKLEAHPEIIERDLDNNWEVLAEAIQTVMRRYHDDKPYEKLKHLTRGKKVDKATLQQFIMELDIPEEAKERLMHITPQNYTGLAEKLARNIENF